MDDMEMRQMDYQALDRLLGALGDEMAVRMPALDVSEAPTRPTTPVVATGRALLIRRLQISGLAVAPLLGLLLLFGQDAVGFLPVYAVFLLVVAMRDALRTGLTWALAWSTIALAVQALVLPQALLLPEASVVPGAEGVPLFASAGSVSILFGLAAFMTGGLFVGALAAFRRGQRRAELPTAEATWWGAAAGSVAAGAVLVGALVLGVTFAAWVGPAVFFGLSGLGAASAAASTRFERRVDEGGAWPARVRDALGISLSWGLGYGLLGLLAGVPLWIFVGLLSGAGFAGILGLAERRRFIEELSPARLAVLGTAGAAISAVVALPLYLVLARGAEGVNVPLFLVLIALLGAGAAAVTVAIGRAMAREAELDDDDDAWMHELRRGPGLLED